jgi:excisionase family DNA binding protein
MNDELTIEEAAQELGVTMEAVRKRLQREGMKGRNIGGRIWLVPRSEVERHRAHPPHRGRPRKDTTTKTT